VRARLQRLFGRLTDSPWPLTLGVLVPFVLLMGWVQARGLDSKLIHRGVVEYWVHGAQPDLAWVPYIHPPGYSLFMNVLDTFNQFWAWDEALFTLWIGWLSRAAMVVTVAGAALRWIGPRWALLAATLTALSPQGVRPFEHYPLASLLGTFALIAVVELGRRGDRRSVYFAVFTVFVAVELHLSTWFLIGGMMATLFFAMPERRRAAFIGSVSMIGAFMLTTYPGLYRVLEVGTGRDDIGDMAEGVATLEWANPLMMALLLVWLTPWFFKRSVPAASLAIGTGFFTIVTTLLQAGQAADGQPYPFSLHYYELVDTATILSAVWALALVWGTGRRWLVSALALLLLLSQAGLFLHGQNYVWLDRFWFWAMLWPF
jgi:hypothetical protein